MNTITIAHFCSYIVDILLIIFVIGRNPSARTNHLCALLITSFSVWSLSFGLANMVHTAEEAMYFFNASMVGLSIFPVAAVWFYLSLTNHMGILKHKATLWLSLFIPAFFLFQQWTGNLITYAVKEQWGWSAIWSQSIYSYLYLAYVMICFSICTIAIIQFGRHAITHGQRKQARMLLMTGLIAVALGLANGIIFQLSDIRNIPQITDILVMIWAVGIVYTVSWYKLMSITPSTIANHILSIMEESIMLLDIQGKIIYANRAATSLHNSKLIDRHFHTIVQDVAKASELLQETTNKGQGCQRELAYISHSGEAVPMLVSASAVHEAHGSVAGFIVSATDISERKRARQEIILSQEIVRKTFHDAVDTIAKIMEMRDPYTGGHQLRVAGLSIAIARDMGLSEEQIDQLRLAATVHDIGKINIAADILNKPGTLSKLEFEIIKEHSRGGYTIVSGLGLPGTIAEAILQHHERMDGSGYPCGLRNHDILMEARILAVADVVEAMASHRPYRPSLGLDQALAEAKTNSGRLYDPVVVNACIRLFEEKNYSLA